MEFKILYRSTGPLCSNWRRKQGAMTNMRQTTLLTNRTTKLTKMGNILQLSSLTRCEDTLSIAMCNILKRAILLGTSCWCTALHLLAIRWIHARGSSTPFRLLLASWVKNEAIRERCRPKHLIKRRKIPCNLSWPYNSNVEDKISNYRQWIAGGAYSKLDRIYKKRNFGIFGQIIVWVPHTRIENLRVVFYAMFGPDRP